jgi:antirestriction protein ArdC
VRLADAQHLLVPDVAGKYVVELAGLVAPHDGPRTLDIILGCREPVNRHRTALHELGHATGHPSHLDRDQSGSYGTKKYAFEALVAELSSAFGCASLGIVPTVRDADYIGSWLEVLREDNRAIVRAASQAGKASDHLLAFVPGTIEPASLDSIVADHEAA